MCQVPQVHGTLYTHLRCLKQRRQGSASGQERCGQLAHCGGVEERSIEVNQRHHIGDIERTNLLTTEKSLQYMDVLLRLYLEKKTASRWLLMR